MTDVLNNLSNVNSFILAPSCMNDINTKLKRRNLISKRNLVEIITVIL